MRHAAASRARSLAVVPAALVALASAACGYVSSQPVTAGRSITVSGRLPADLQSVMGVCTPRLTVAAGQTELLGQRDVLPGCTDASGRLDTAPLVAAAPDNLTALRWSLVAGAIGARVNETFAAPLPTTIATRPIASASVSPLAWALPLLDGALANDGVPPVVRQSVLSVFAAAVAQSSCELTGTVNVTFRRLGLENFRFRWTTVNGAEPQLRVDAAIDANRTVAGYRINTAFTCNGSTNNLLHGLLQTLFPNTPHGVSIPDGGVRVRVLLDPVQGRVAGTSRVELDVRAIDVARPFSWIPQDAWRQMLTDMGVTAQAVEDDVRPRLEAPLANLGTQVGAAVNEALRLESNERVQGIDVDDATPRNLVVTTRYSGCVTLVTGQTICLPPRF